MNDPNGLVYFMGEYHLFFQYNPQGKDWGHMSWGHAVSPDLMRWSELPVAIPETDQMIFSGSAVVDWANVSGLGDGLVPPLIAHFTAYDPMRAIQSQHLAFSQDRGRSFTHYAHNPIIDLNAADFRDPKVFYHAPSGAWIMVVVLARDHVVQFYRSQDLCGWTLAGAFGPAGSVSGQWECPDLIHAPMDGDPETLHWVLKIDVDAGLVDGGSGAQYFVGRFDGFAFTADPDLADPNGALVDCGPDFYAAVTWSDPPAETPGPIWIGWQSNHQTGKSYPTDPWRGAQSLPRTLVLFEERGQLRLGQRPVDAVNGLREEPISAPGRRFSNDAPLTVDLSSSAFELALTIDGGEEAAAEVSLVDDDGALVTITADFSSQDLTFARHRTAEIDAEDFDRTVKTLLPQSHAMSLRLFMDCSLVEIFVDDGRRVYSACVFPRGAVKVSVRRTSGEVGVDQITGWTLRRSMDFSDGALRSDEIV